MSDNITLLIGRDEDANRLAVRTSTGKLMLIGREDSVPNSVSRYRPDLNTAHAAVTIDPVTQQMEIVNLNPLNYTWVGQERVLDTPVALKWSSAVTLGGDYYALDLASILKKIGLKRPVGVKQLEPVWHHYERELFNLNVEQQRKANQQRLQSICSLAGMALVGGSSMFNFGPEVAKYMEVIRYFLLGMALLLVLFFFFKGRNIKDSFTMRKQALDKWLQDNYKCPSCGAPIGLTQFNQLGFRRCINCQKRFSTDE